MINLLFSPSGRINSDTFIRGALILIATKFFIHISPLINYSLSILLSLVGIVLFWCWIALWIKRYQDSGSSGWMSLIPIILYIILAMLIVPFIMERFNLTGISPELEAEINNMAMDVAESGDFGSMFSDLMGASAEIAKQMALPNAIGSALSSLIIAFGLNALIKQDPQDNQYGPVA